MPQPHKRIVHLVATLDTGGIQNLVLGISTANPENKHSVICLLGARGDLLEHYRAAEIDVYACKIHWLPRTRFLPQSVQNWLRWLSEKTFSLRLAWLLKWISADIVHTHLPRRIDLVADSVFRLARLPLVWAIHAENLYFDERDAVVLQKAKSLFLRYGRGIITTDSNLIRKTFLKHFPETNNIVKIVHPGANIRQFQKEIPQDPVWRKRFGIPENAILFGSCGRLAHVKGFDIFIRAAAQLIDDNIDAHFAISGKGEEMENLSKLIQELGLADRFHLLGFQADLAYTIEQFDAFVLSSRSEGFPLSLIEALAAGLPSIATDISGVREMLGENGGIVVPPENPPAIKEAMYTMLNLATRQKYSNEAKKRGVLFSFENCALKFEAIYSSLLQ